MYKEINGVKGKIKVDKNDEGKRDIYIHQNSGQALHKFYT